MPTPPDDADPYEHLTQAQLHPVTDSPWLGQTVHGPRRARSTVERVYATPFGADVALCLHRASVYDTLRLEVTDMLSTPERPAAQRTAYLRNHRQLLRLHGTVVDGTATRRTHQAIQRRTAIWQQFHHAKVYVEAALLEQVETGDRVVSNLGIQMTVTNPDARRSRLMGWRTQMQVELTPDFIKFSGPWGWPDGRGTRHIEHEGWGLLPTLGLI